MSNGVSYDNRKNTFSYLLFNKPTTLVLALLAAIAIWFYISKKVERTKEFNVSIELQTKQAGSSHVISKISNPAGKEVEDQVKVTLRGPAGALARVNERELRINREVIYPSQEEDRKVDQQISISEADLQLPVGVYIHKPDPLYLTLHFEKKITKQKELSFSRERFFRGEPAPGFKLGDATLSDKTIEVRGPFSTMENLEEMQILPRNRINLEGRTASIINRQIRLRIYPPHLYVRLQPQTVTLHVEIVNEKKEIVIEVPVGIWIQPKYAETLKSRKWKMSPANGKIETRFRIPKQWSSDRFQESNVMFVFLPNSSDLTSLQDASAPYTVDTGRLRILFQGLSQEEKNKIEIKKILQEDIIFRSQ